MDRTLSRPLATVVVGRLIALQAPINSGLGKATGTLAGGRDLVHGRHGAAARHRAS